MGRSSGVLHNDRLEKDAKTEKEHDDERKQMKVTFK